MSDPGRAVFLSYASQDAEAARRIADALRQVGVEVWFDQNELRGGDAWDQSIRRQIKECALFVPIISANTQARPEGYFRREWRLAVDRMHDMADDLPFLVPVVVDDTSDTVARVPERFRERQWTRLRLDETPTELASRVAKLLAGEPATGDPKAIGTGANARMDRARRRPHPAFRYAWAAVGIALAVFYGLRPLWKPGRDGSASAREAREAALRLPSEARKLAAQARALIDDDPLAVRENYLTAKRLGERAIELDPGDAGAYAVVARAACELIKQYQDSSPASLAAARSRAESAIRLDPGSLEAALALAFVDLLTKTRPAEVGQRLESLLSRAPDDRRVLHLLQLAALVQNQIEEAQKWIERAISLPGGDPQSLDQRASIFWGLNQYPQMAATLERSLAQRPTALAAHLKLMLLVWGWGDLPAGRAWVEKMPESLLQEDRVAMLAFLTWYWSRQPDRAIEILRRNPRPFFEEGSLFISTGYLAGCAQLLAGRSTAAEVEFTAGLKAINERLGQEPTNQKYLYEKIRLLARLGQGSEAEQSLRVLQELAGSDARFYRRAEVLVLVGAAEEALAICERSIDQSQSRWPIRANELRYDPVFDPLRNDPRFQAIVARGEAQLAQLRAGGAPAPVIPATPAAPLPP